jgi:hypothetical protein
VTIGCLFDSNTGSPSAELAGSVSVSVSSSSAADVSLTDERGASGRKDNKDKSSGGLLKLFRCVEPGDQRIFSILGGSFITLGLLYYT